MQFTISRVSLFSDGKYTHLVVLKSDEHVILINSEQNAIPMRIPTDTTIAVGSLECIPSWVEVVVTNTVLYFAIGELGRAGQLWYCNTLARLANRYKVLARLIKERKLVALELCVE